MSALAQPTGLTITHSPHTGDRLKVKRVRRPRAGDDWQAKFLAAYLEYGTIVAACAATGVGRRTVYDYRAKDEEFARMLADVDEMVTESLEQEGLRRALDGSDRLLEFFLKARRPERYSEQHRLVHSGSIDTHTPLTAEQEAEELAAFGMPAALAAAAGPHAVTPPADA